MQLPLIIGLVLGHQGLLYLHPLHPWQSAFKGQPQYRAHTGQRFPDSEARRLVQELLLSFVATNLTDGTLIKLLRKLRITPLPVALTVRSDCLDDRLWWKENLA